MKRCLFSILVASISILSCSKTSDDGVEFKTRQETIERNDSLNTVKYRKQHVDLHSGQLAREYSIEKISDCEYIFFVYSSGGTLSRAGLTHKGDCNNPIHFQNK